MDVDFNFMVGGEAWQVVQSVGLSTERDCQSTKTSYRHFAGAPS